MPHSSCLVNPLGQRERVAGGRRGEEKIACCVCLGHWRFRVNLEIPYIWGSAHCGSFSVRRNPEIIHGETKRGMEVICCLKKDQSKVLVAGRSSTVQKDTV